MAGKPKINSLTGNLNKLNVILTVSAKGLILMVEWWCAWAGVTSINGPGDWDVHASAAGYTSILSRVTGAALKVRGGV